MLSLYHSICLCLSRLHHTVYCIVKMWQEPRLFNSRDECTVMRSLYHSICLCLSRLQHTIYCIVKIWHEPRLFNSRGECTVMLSAGQQDGGPRAVEACFLWRQTRNGHQRGTNRLGADGWAHDRLTLFFLPPPPPPPPITPPLLRPPSHLALFIPPLSLSESLSLSFSLSLVVRQVFDWT